MKKIVIVFLMLIGSPTCLLQCGKGCLMAPDMALKFLMCSIASMAAEAGQGQHPKTKNWPKQ